MGAAGGAIFCENGHLIDEWGHHEYAQENVMNKPCPHCGSTKLKDEWEWGDSSYGPHKVPYKSCGVDKNDEPIYDVSKLFKEKFCERCGAEIPFAEDKDNICTTCKREIEVGLS